MRIIAGRFKGRRLCTFTGRHIRPMTARVKTSVFDVLSSRISFSSHKILDLFSGTGSLAFESLSRGAKEAHLVDSGRQFISVVEKNVQLLKIDKEVVIYHRDVFRFLSSRVVTGRRSIEFGLIFADPPFNKEWGLKVLSYLRRFTAIQAGAICVLEISIQESSPPSTDSYHLFTERKFGDKKVLFYQWKGFAT